MLPLGARILDAQHTPKVQHRVHWETPQPELAGPMRAKVDGIFSLVTTRPIDTSTSIRKLLLGVLAAIAEFENALIIERTKEGLAKTNAQVKKLERESAPWILLRARQ